MKYLITMAMALTTFCCGAQTIQNGDNLLEEYKKLSKPYFFKAPALTNWTEGANMLFIGSKPNPNDCEFLFLALKDTTLVGAFKMTSPAVFLIDTEGNSIMNSSSELLLLPLWTVKRKTKINSSDKRILELLDKMYQKTLQANELELDEATMKEYQQYQTDTSLANRHIALLFDNYQTIINETAAKGQKAPASICVPLMKSLGIECLSLYNSIPVIVCIYMGEALQNAGMKEQAREHFKQSLQFYPNSIPLLVYNYQLELDPGKKKDQLLALKKKYPTHWMVKDL